MCAACVARRDLSLIDSVVADVISASMARSDAGRGGRRIADRIVERAIEDASAGEHSWEDGTNFWIHGWVREGARAAVGRGGTSCQ